MHEFESTTLWQRTLARRDDAEEPQREKLRQAFLAFRDRVALLIAHIKTELPDLTLHDITHVDALWRVASEVIGDDYPINPAEAFVLGGAFLLHDAAHCRAAFFKGGLEEIRQTPQWQDAAALAGCDGQTLSETDPQFQRVLFDALRVLHPLKAEDLPFAAWGDQPGDTLQLLPHDELRDAYGHVIGQVARSHWQSPHELEPFAAQSITAPVCLSPCSWEVNPLKLALILRTADALHMDAKRAPRFLMQISPPQSRVSAEHWTFQSKLNMVKRDEARQEVKITGSPFKAEEQQAWWLAYDAARLADRELDAAWLLLREKGLPPFAVREVAGVRSPHAFANLVPAQGWLPVDTEVRISQVHRLVESFGGAKLYGDEPHWALRELLQNALDAVHAWRKVAGVEGLEGEIEVALEPAPADEDQCWLHVTDTGIGMSRYVLTQVLLDFGRSLWRSPELSAEWQGLAASKFEAIGQFGIGFFSVFMLGQQVKVTTRRCEQIDGESNQYVLEFSDGVRARPVLRSPHPEEKLLKHGTRVSVLVSKDKFERMPCCASIDLSSLLAWLAPAIDIDMYYREASHSRRVVVKAGDWTGLSSEQLSSRIYGQAFDFPFVKILKSSSAVVAGRVAREGGFYISGGLNFLESAVCVGVVQGLRAGLVSGLSGIVFCRDQSDLTRKNAIPDVDWQDIRCWAEAYKNELLRRHELDIKNSAMLAAFGRKDDCLILGSMNGGDVKNAELAEIMRSNKELVVHYGSIDLNIDFSTSQQRSFRPEPLLLCLERYPLPSWIAMIENADFDGSLKNIIWSIVSEVWGGDVEWRKGDAMVGVCDGQQVWRECWIARRTEFQAQQVVSP